MHVYVLRRRFIIRLTLWSVKPYHIHAYQRMLFIQIVGLLGLHTLLTHFFRTKYFHAMELKTYLRPTTLAAIIEDLRDGLRVSINPTEHSFLSDQRQIFTDTLLSLIGEEDACKLLK